MARGDMVRLAAWGIVLVLAAAGLWATAAGLALGMIAGRVFR